MGEARRKRLLLKKKELKLSHANTKVESAFAKLVELRRKYTEVTRPWRKHLEAFANEVGPTIFPKDSSAIAKFLLSKSDYIVDVVGKNVSRVDTASMLAALLDPYVKQHVKPLKRGLEILHAAVERNIADADVHADDCARPTTFRDVAHTLDIIFAERMLSKERLPGVYVPFEEIDWAKHMTPDDAMRLAKGAARLFAMSEESLQGAAAQARDSFNALGAASNRAFIAFASDSPADMLAAIRTRARVTKDHIVLQDIFDACLHVITQVARNKGESEAHCYAFALAKMIVREETITEGEILAAVSNALPPVAIDDNDDIMMRNEAALTGAAREARILFSALDDRYRNELIQWADTLEPDKIRIVFAAMDRAIHSPNAPTWALQAMFDSVLPDIHSKFLRGRPAQITSDLGREDLAPILAYLIARKMVNHVRQSVQTASAKDDIAGILKGVPDNDKRDILKSVKHHFEVEDRLASQSRIWDDSDLTFVGVNLWERTYKVGLGDAEVIQAAEIVAKALA